MFWIHLIVSLYEIISLHVMCCLTAGPQNFDDCGDERMVDKQATRTCSHVRMHVRLITVLVSSWVLWLPAFRGDSEYGKWQREMKCMRHCCSSCVVEYRNTCVHLSESPLQYFYLYCNTIVGLYIWIGCSSIRSGGAWEL